MNTKRCAYCHKLSRADAVTCSRCGRSFAASASSTPARSFDTPADNKGNVVEKNVTLRTRRRTIPPASPHRAGHFSGLHPEDQPYQSTMLAVQRPPETQAKPAAQQRPDIAYLPEAPHPPPDDAAFSSWPTAPTEVQTHLQDRPALPAYLPNFDARAKAWGRRSGSPFWQGRYVPVVLTISCLIFLVASSLLAYIFINKRPAANSQVLSATPNQLRVNDTFALAGKGFGVNDLIAFTHDQNNAPILDGSGKPMQTHADDRGTFSVRIVVPTGWDVGQHTIHAEDIEQTLSVVAVITVEQSSLAPPELQLVSSKIDFGASISGVVTKKDFTLVNVGGQQVVWQASSDQPWLSISPKSGTFSGRANTTITVNSGALAPQSYTGHITFIQQGKQPLTLTVTLVVKAAPPATQAITPVAPGGVIASPSSLSFASTGQNPAAQTVTIQNSGGGSLGWWATTYTVDGANWLNATPASGNLAANQAANVTVSINVATLKPRSYQGTVTVTYGTSGQTVQIPVSLSVSISTAPAINLNQSALNFSTLLGISPSSQAFTIKNTGNATLNWVISEDQNGATFAPVSSYTGSLAPAQSTTITVTPTVAKASVGTLATHITVADSDAGSRIPKQTITVNIVVKGQPQISLSLKTIAFNHDSVITQSSQLLDIANSGTDTLNWTIQSSASWLTPYTTGGSISPGKDMITEIFCNSSALSTGTYTATLVVSDSDAGTTVVTQSVPVTLVVN